MVTKRRRSRLSQGVQQELIQHFVTGVTARTAAEIVGCNRHTATLFFHKLREVIAARLAQQAPRFSGEIEVDESYFGGHRKGKRGRGAAGKVPVFGLLNREGQVHAVMIKDAKAETLLGIIRERVEPDSLVFSDSYKGYNALNVAGFRHQRINHSKDFARGRNHINGIENFWNQAKRQLRRYNGIPKAHFHLFLKECEWRFNHRPASRLLRTLEGWLDHHNKGC